MNNLLEVTRLLNKKKVKKIEIFDEYNLKNKKSKFNELYEALLIEKFKSDNEASEALYGCLAVDDRYRQLKSRFRKRLHNTLFFLDVNTPSISSFERARYNCDKEWAIVNILEQNGAINSSTKLAKSVLKLALKFQFTDIIIASSRYLKKQAIISFDYSQIETYKKSEEEYTYILGIEKEAEDIYLEVYNIFFHPKLDKGEKREKIQIHLDKLLKLTDKNAMPKIKNFSFKAYFYLLELDKDFNSLRELSLEAINLNNENLSLFNSQDRASWYFNILYAEYLIGANKNINQLAQSGLKSISYQAQNWLHYRSLFFTTTMHDQNYMACVNILNDTIQSHQFKKASHKERFIWQYVFAPFLKFIILSHKDNNPLLRVQKLRFFKTSTYLESPLHEANKKDLDLVYSSLIAKLVLSIRTNTPNEELLYRGQKLSMKKIKRSGFDRSKIFLKCVYNIEFNKKDKPTQIKTAIEKLKNSPKYFRSNDFPVEIIPYETLINIIYTQNT